MKIINNKIKHDLNLRTEKDYPTKGVEFIDINPLILQKEVLEEITNLFYEELKDKNIDYVVGPEARGFIFGSNIAYKLNTGFIPVRKKGKLPPTTVEATFEYEKEYGIDTLELPKLVNTSYKGKNFYIVDDVYATGNTLKSVKENITKLGGNVVGMGVVINILELNNDDIFSLIDINEE
jgi:adenine phosphoribosyltransferase